MSALGKIVRSGVGRRRVQTLVMVLTTLAAVTSSVLSLGLLATVQGPFDRAFSSRHGAHLAVQFDASKATAAQLAGTAHAAGVTQAAGPYPVAASVDSTIGADCGKGPDGFQWGGTSNGPVTLTTRPVLSGADIDRLQLTDGRWPAGPGEIVLSDWPQPCLDKSVMFDKLPGRPSFTVVGVAKSLTATADGFLTADGFARLAAAGATVDQQMLYRFAVASTDAQVAADKQAIVAAAPGGSIQGAQSYLQAKQHATGNAKSFVPFLIVFGVLGLFLSVLIISIVVSGAVVAAVRRIGILKALGFTPAQVARAYVAQALIPAALGVVVGAVIGNMLASPVLNGTSHELGAAGAAIPLWVDLLVPLGTLVVVGVTAVVPALRAARLPAVSSLSVGRARSAERGRAAQRLAGRLPLPRPMSLGLAQPFARPSRAVLVGAAVLFGAVSTTFALGMESSFTKFQGQRQAGFDAGATIVHPVNQDPTAPADSSGPQLDAAKVAAAVAAVPGTLHSFGWGQADASVIGMPSDTAVDTLTGDATWTGLDMIDGRWYAAPGEAVVGERLAASVSTHVGDTLTVVQQGRTVRLTVVGIAFDLHRSGKSVITDAASLTDAGLAPHIDRFNIDLAPGSDSQTWLASANAAVRPLDAVAGQNPGGHKSDVVITMSALVATLTLMLVAVAALGVLNTVVQDTRERIHDLGVFKALGMSPRQTVAMVLTSVSLTGLLAGLVGVPIGAAIESAVLKPTENAVGMHMPQAVTHVYTPMLILPLLAGGIVIALVGALLPASWAARTSTAAALRTE